MPQSGLGLQARPWLGASSRCKTGKMNLHKLVFAKSGISIFGTTRFWSKFSSRVCGCRALHEKTTWPRVGSIHAHVAVGSFARWILSGSTCERSTTFFVFSCFFFLSYSVADSQSSAPLSLIPILMRWKRHQQRPALLLCPLLRLHPLLLLPMNNLEEVDIVVVAPVSAPAEASVRLIYL